MNTNNKPYCVLCQPEALAGYAELDERFEVREATKLEVVLGREVPVSAKEWKSVK